MTSLRQIEANRHNALKSTGPKTETGKGQSRRNALRHGFTAETVQPLENPEEYRAFEDAIVLEYLPHTPVEQELVHRLASVFWRLRRASSIETGLLRMQGKILHAFRSARQNWSCGIGLFLPVKLRISNSGKHRVNYRPRNSVAPRAGSLRDIGRR